MTLRRTLLAIGLCLLPASPVFATNGMRMPGFGPVQSSMGGAGTAASLDSCTLVSNPAGLTSLDARVDVAGSWFMASVDYSASESPLRLASPARWWRSPASSSPRSAAARPSPPSPA